MKINRRILQIAKVIWFVIVIAAAGYYLISHFSTLAQYIQSIKTIKVILSLLLLLTGKFILAILSGYSLLGQPWQPGFKEMIYINSLTQLAKYIPGGIWQYVGRFGLYQAKGLAKIQSGRVILVENVWLLVSAVFVGAITGYEFILHWLKVTITPGILVGWIAALMALWLLALWLINRFSGLEKRTIPWMISRLMVFQGLAWLCIGLSFWILLPDSYSTFQILWPSIGAYCCSWAIGFVTIFAPGGIGVREATLALMLAAYMPTESGVIYGTFNRLIWVIVELLLGIGCELLLGSKMDTEFDKH